MSYNAFITKQARKDIATLPSPKKELFKHKIAALKQQPYSGKKLKGEFAGLYSLRLWPYRIVYEVHKKEKEIIVIAVEHRQEVYKK